MPDWSKSMQQTFEYYLVDPGTWANKKLIRTVKTCSINRDSEVDTLGSASFDVIDSIDECYIRVYLVTVQDGIEEKHPLGTFLVQTPGKSFDGKVATMSLDAYTPLLELKENPPPIGYYIPRGEGIMDSAYRVTKEHMRAPVVKPYNTEQIYFDFVSNTDDNWLTFVRDLISNAKFIFSIDEMGRILFAPKQDTASLQPVWTFDDDNSSILHPAVSVSHDLYGIPNVVEVIYSSGNEMYYSRVVNDDPNSPISTVNRGREIVHRVTNAEFTGVPTQYQIDEYAKQLLRDLSSVEFTISYTHGYCPVRINDCVRLNYTRAGLVNIKAKVISQSIKCEPGCPVTEKAVFTNSLWR